ncbi:hypothetical protein BN946_scf184753.g12 [Trametes cinnabarina]|uniref:Uncharacterized protein n=1 Tax=Pycnoporus cinnabarinus TaxID=5643 RepID=A0A060SRV9_PYCCI|nr:hypothetical protein BN946_scf184753.g12 [Trametes cinnabarina]
MYFMSLVVLALFALCAQAAPTKRDGVIQVPGFPPYIGINDPGLPSGVTTTVSPESALAVIQANTTSVALAIGTEGLLNAEAAFVKQQAQNAIPSTATQLTVFLENVAGTPVVEVSSVGGAAITLATGTASGGFVTNFAGYTFTAAPKSNFATTDLRVPRTLVVGALTIMGSVAVGALAVL